MATKHLTQSEVARRWCLSPRTLGRPQQDRREGLLHHLRPGGVKHLNHEVGHHQKRRGSSRFPALYRVGCAPTQRESSVTRRASRTTETETTMTTTALTHETAEGSQDRAAWQQLLATALRSTDSVGRAMI